MESRKRNVSGHRPFFFLSFSIEGFFYGSARRILRVAREEGRSAVGLCGCYLRFHWSTDRACILRASLFLVYALSSLNNVSSPCTAFTNSWDWKMAENHSTFHQNPHKEELVQEKHDKKEKAFWYGRKDVCAGIHSKLYWVPHFRGSFTQVQWNIRACSDSRYFLGSASYPHICLPAI